MMRRQAAVLQMILLAAAATVCTAETVLRLDERDWSLTNENGTLTLSTSLPAYPLEVLRANGVIGDPLYRYGEQEARWVALETWTFKAAISAEEAAQLAANEQVLLYLGGVDTFATISINDEQVLETDNFHRYWTVPVKQALRTDAENSITVAIRSAYKESLKLKAANPYLIPTLNNTGSIGAYNFARKPAFDFGWDWGPALAASGIHGSVKFVAFSEPTLSGAYVSQAPTADGFALNITSQFYVPPSGGKGLLTVALPELKRGRRQAVTFTTSDLTPADDAVASVTTSLLFKKSEVQLWWPAGGNYGPQKLYDVAISFTPDGSAACASERKGKLKATPAGKEADAVAKAKAAGAEVLKAKTPGDANADSGDGDADKGAAVIAGFSASSASCAAAGSSLSKRVGFRTIELVRDPAPKAVKDLFGAKKGFEYEQQKMHVAGFLARTGDGQWAMNEKGDWTHFPGTDTDVPGAVAESFYFRVNGVPIYMKGANIIPMSVLPSNTTAGIINMTLRAAVDANQNMLRVWGGGLYHPEELYEFCDEHGLLIWQDAMFGGSHYPTSTDFLSNIAIETAQQAQRLSWHPSVALWNGNNELELSYEWPHNTVVRSNRNKFAEDYMVNVNLVRKQIKKVNPGTIFVSSSPSKGAIVDTPEQMSLRWGWIGDSRYGTVHHYDYMSDCEDFRSYPPAKFVSEFGWQSYPMLETYAAAMDPANDWGVGNPMNEFRNRRTDVTPEFLSQYARHFKLPKDWNPADTSERLTRFKSYLWIGHMQHARCYETALNLWRRLRSHAKSLTMGVMYWQLNDIWAGASWSSVDISGRWKPVHYAVKRAYAPIAVQAVRDNGVVDVFIVSDLLNATSVTLTLKLVSIADSADKCASLGAQQTVVRTTVDVPGSFATRVLSQDAAALLKRRPGCAPETCFLSVSASAKGVAQSESQLWFVPFKDVAFPDPNIRITNLEQAAPGALDITLESERPAALVLLSETAPLRGHFSDNVFASNPCEERVVRFTSIDGPIDPADASMDFFRVESLFDHSSWADAAEQPEVALPPGAADASDADDVAASAGGGGVGVAAVKAEADEPSDAGWFRDSAQTVFRPT